MTRKTSNNKKDFKDVFKEILSANKNHSVPLTAQLQTSMGLLIILLKHLKNVNNGQLLVESLKEIYVILSNTDPGSFNIDDSSKLSVVNDVQFSQARNYLLELIIDRDQSKEVRQLAFKILLQLGITRYSVEDYLTVCGSLNTLK